MTKRSLAVKFLVWGEMLLFKLHEIRELIKLMDQSTLQSLEVEEEGSRLRLKKASASGAGAVIAASVPAAAPDAPSASSQPVASPAPAPGQVAAAVAPAESAPVSEASSAENIHTIVSPMVGTFYAAPSPDSPPYVKAGDKVEPGSVVCIVEAMKLMNEIEAEVQGEIVEVLVKNGQLVEYGQPLFLVRVE